LLRTFVRKILRKIYGPIQERDIWRSRNDEELNRFINGEDNVNKMAGTCRENGNGSDDKKDDGKKIVYTY